jgi:23S rRNA pseudouridine1911/1915/1917 synthase
MSLHTLHKLTVADSGQFLFAAVASALPGLSRHQARLAVMAGLVTLDGRVDIRPKTVLPERCVITVDLRQGVRRPFVARAHAQIGPTERPFTILHQDLVLIVVDKTAGIISAPSARGERGHIPELLRRTLRKREEEPSYIGVVHRLDKETSGCLCFALRRDAQSLLAAQFADHSARRVYRCIVQGQPRKDQDTISGNLAHGKFGRRVLLQDEDADERPGKESVTHFKIIKKHGRVTELEVELETGRTHQIRVSLAAIGCPVLGDRVYGFRGADRTLAKGQQPLPAPPRLMLHAHTLELDHPGSGKRLTFTAPMPEAFAAYLRLIDKR